ncbi:MAG: type II toxin-antitoxin system RelE family toxin [Bryobacteraceae bacterium]
MSDPVHTIKLSRQAASYFRRLDTDTKRRIGEALRDAQKNPVEASDHLVNRGSERKVRVGNLRILFRVESKEILVDAILPRGDVYKHTRR